MTGMLVSEQMYDLIDVTSLRRPDTAWQFVDAHGHMHRWFNGSEPATTYNPESKYTTPSLKWVKDGESYWPDDDEPHDVGHLECSECGEHIKPGYRADDCQQFIRGLRYR